MSAISDDKVPPYVIFSDTEADTAFHEESGSHDVVLKNIIAEEVTKDSDKRRRHQKDAAMDSKNTSKEDSDL